MSKRALAPMWRYTIAAYGAFWAIILVLGGLASMVFDAPPAVMTAITILGSWSPTIVLLLMLKGLKPGVTIGAFYRRAFRDRVAVPWLIAIPLLVFGVFLAAVALLSVLDGTPLAAHLALPSALGWVVLLTVFQGPSGEESGWRGYLRPELEQRYGFLQGNLVLGLVWAFWHAPLWFVASDYAGTDAWVFIAANVVVLTAVTLVMAVIMARCDNLLIAFWVHFCFNLSLRFFVGDVGFFVALSVLYVVAAAVLLLLFPRPARTPSLDRVGRLAPSSEGSAP